jgi:hypothetical protein
MKSCLVCGQVHVERMLDFGAQPVSSHYRRAAREAAETYPQALGLCRACGVVQLDPPVPYKALVPSFDWIAYREPETHLDAVVDRIMALPNVGPKCVAAGISYKDATTVERLARRGLARTWMIDPKDDLGATDPNANIETVHGLLTIEAAQTMAERRGPADLLIVRHIAEHAGTPARFMEALDALLAPGGYMVIEVPDCERSLALRDYTMVWEEHSLYFTRDTLPALLEQGPFETVDLEVHPYPFEDVLVLYAQKKTADVAGNTDAARPKTHATLALVDAYAAEFEARKEKIRTALKGLRQDGPLALYGAGHLTCTFMGVHGVADRFDFVVDDTPQKQGLYLPGSGLPIVSREHLARSNVAHCLLGLAPELEDKVIGNNGKFVDRGGIFHSIFAASSRAIHSLIPSD